MQNIPISATSATHCCKNVAKQAQDWRKRRMISSKPMIARATELSETVAARETEIVNFEERLAAQAAESKSAETAIEKQIAQRADLEAAVAVLINQRAERSSATNEMESNVRAARNTLNELHDLRSKHQVRETQLQLQIDNLAEHISHRYQLNLRDFAPDQIVFDKTLRAQLKRRAGGIERSALDANNGGEASSNETSRSESTIHLDVDLRSEEHTSELQSLRHL